ncbi:MAG: hypothetical protein V1495_07865 [Pseudomonadota bacterium]
MIWRGLRCSAVLVLLAVPAGATEVHGGGELGFWYLQNDVSDAAGFQLDDGYGAIYVQRRYMLGNLHLKLDALDLGNGSNTKYNTHFDGRVLWNINHHADSLAIPDRTRQQVDELSLEAAGIGERTDLWLGRQTLYEAGGVGVDGARVIYHLSDQLGFGVYGGLANDPRNFTGYIGPAYRSRPFSSHFETGGLFLSQKSERLRLDAAVNAGFYKAKIDRLAVYSQAVYQLNPTWTFSGMADLGVAGDRGIKGVSAFVTTRVTSRITNTASFLRFTTLRYKESNVSAIPVPAGIDASLVRGADVVTSSYNSGRDQVQIRILDRNYIFGGFQVTRRTFDDANQFKYTAGYRDPTLFGSTFDLRLQTDVIDNYRGFNTALDTLLGKEFSDGKVRLEGGATFYANERNLASEVGKDRSYRFNVFYLPTKTFSWLINYALHEERDVVNGSQRIRVHDLYFSSAFRF